MTQSPPPAAQPTGTARARRKSTEPQTTRTRLQAIIKSSRNIMRKDAGLNGELDRLPQLAWLLFLRALDEVEQDRAIGDTSYRPAIAGRFRWSEWARSDRTGEPLLDFVNGELLPHLRSLRGSGSAGDPRDTVAAIFENIANRMLSGYLLKDLVDQLNRVDFANADDLHTMAHLYESMLKEMRDAAGDSGEFYTPRPLVRFITDMVDPRVGEEVMDPAMGTGGFLVEAYEHMLAQTSTAMQREVVKQSIRGIEKKSMPYLLAQMNFLLHEVDQVRAVQANALANGIREMRNDGVDVILTNPPFGGEEEKGIQTNFPVGMRASETVWLFLQAVIARLEKRKGRGAVVVPNSVLFDQGIGARIKAELMAKFNLHTVLRLPNGVFAPYTLIPSNVLFFEHGPQSEQIWFYEHPLPEGRKNYTKTKQLAYEEFAACAAWWGGTERVGRKENEFVWSVPAAEVAASGYDLDRRNPHQPDDLSQQSSAAIIDDLVEIEREILGLLTTLQHETDSLKRLSVRQYTSRPLREVLERKLGVPIHHDRQYRISGVYSFGRGLLDRGVISGMDTKYESLTRLAHGDVVYSKLGAFEGAVAVVDETFAGTYVSPEFPVFKIVGDIDPEYLRHQLTSPAFEALLSAASSGVGARQKRVHPENFLDQSIIVPPRLTQQNVLPILGKIGRAVELTNRAHFLSRFLLPSARNEIFNAMR